MRPARGRTALLVVAALTLVCGWAPSASATPHGGPSEEWSSSVVSRLTIASDGRGWLTVQTHFLSDEYQGFDVMIRAAGGSWSGAADVAVPGLDAHCLLDPGPDLHYRCGRTAEPEPPRSFFPAGDYSITLPVRRTGPIAGLWGSSQVHSYFWSSPFPPYVQAYAFDAFPVEDASHFRSTAEVGVARTRVQWTGFEQTSAQEQLMASVTVEPGEAVTALDVPFGDGRLRVTGTNAPAHGLQCYVRLGGLHCKPATGRAAFPTGRYQLVVDLAVVRTAAGLQFPTGHHLDLTVDGGAPETVDSFGWAERERY